MLERGAELSFEVPANPGNDIRISKKNAIPTLKKRFSEGRIFIFTILFYLTSRSLVENYILQVEYCI